LPQNQTHAEDFSVEGQRKKEMHSDVSRHGESANGPARQRKVEGQKNVLAMLVLTKEGAGGQSISRFLAPITP